MIIKHNFKTLLIILGLLTTPLTTFAYDSEHNNHGIKVETSDTRLAYPTNIHTFISEKGVEIQGALKRKGHKNNRLRGTIVIALVSADGMVIEQKTIKVRNKSGSAKHDHSRTFSTTMMLPKTKDFSVRVRHILGKVEKE